MRFRDTVGGGHPVEAPPFHDPLKAAIDSESQNKSVSSAIGTAGK